MTLGKTLSDTRFFTTALAYADDIVLMAKEGRDIKENVEKSKMVSFRKGERKKTVVEWKWRGERIDEVKEFKYLGYKLTINGADNGHIEETPKKAKVVIKQVWGIGKRRFAYNYRS